MVVAGVCYGSGEVKPDDLSIRLLQKPNLALPPLERALSATLKTPARETRESSSTGLSLRNNPLHGLLRAPASSGEGTSLLLARQLERVAVVELPVEHGIAQQRGAVFPEPAADRLQEGVGCGVGDPARFFLLLLLLLLLLQARAFDISTGQVEGAAAGGEESAAAGFALLGVVGKAGAGDLERVAGLGNLVSEVGEVVGSADGRGTGTLGAGGCDGGQGLGEPLLGRTRAVGEGCVGGSSGGEHVGRNGDVDVVVVMAVVVVVLW
jgi:hypothetical protein